MNKIRDRPHRVRFSREHSDELLPLFVVGYGGQLTFDQYAGGCGPPVSLVGIAPALHVTRMVRDEAVDGLDDVGGFEAIPQGCRHAEPV